VPTGAVRSATGHETVEMAPCTVYSRVEQGAPVRCLATDLVAYDYSELIEAHALNSLLPSV
jgi:hypothetical protein